MAPGLRNPKQLANRFLLPVHVDVIDRVKAYGAVEEVVLDVQVEEAPVQIDAVVANFALCLAQGRGGQVDTVALGK